MSTKTWTSKVDWDGGTYDKLLCPIGLNRLEILRDNLSGKSTYIFDGGANKKFNWATFSHSKENKKIVYRDDCSEDAKGVYVIHPCESHDGTEKGTISYEAANKRYKILTGDNKGVWLEIPSVSIKDFALTWEIYIYNDYPANCRAMPYGRYQDADNMYYGSADCAGALTSPLIQKEGGGTLSTVASNPSNTYFSENTWIVQKLTISGSSILIQTTGVPDLSGTDGSLPNAGKVLPGWWQGDGYLRSILLEHYSLPSPAGTTVSFKFWGSNDGANWGCEHADIKDVPHSRCIKIEVTMARESLAKAMPVLNDMTLTYYEMKPQPIFI